MGAGGAFRGALLSVSPWTPVLLPMQGACCGVPVTSGEYYPQQQYSQGYPPQNYQAGYPPQGYPPQGYGQPGYGQPGYGGPVVYNQQPPPCGMGVGTGLVLGAGAGFLGGALIGSALTPG
ncbi:hypothetical protein APUTEX25_004461 [Auxenochlorella protothecoides]|uniref:Rhodopsin n=1 Tax=Auxenochlorella protothecoides TaxID=3075 RepID=A0A3M7L0D1_AUXPR|nr:hypothetical protein APUTEX25_004461 [Auxenochlorella protothecoides]|eukprot:RMZ56037.1 hypothetical protein APUTEX25_004461 [Auxenochlorella protothecoides]